MMMVRNDGSEAEMEERERGRDIDTIKRSR